MSLTHTTKIISGPGAVSLPIVGGDGIVFSGDQMDIEAFRQAPIPEMYRSFVFSGDQTDIETALQAPIPEAYRAIVFDGAVGQKRKQDE
jgi:hypothetical protein